MKGKLSAMQQEIALARRQAGQLATKLRLFCSDVDASMAYYQQPERLIQEVYGLYVKFVSASASSIEDDPDVMEEYQRQRVYLERSVDALKIKYEKDSEV
jgi:hypothetical protein